MKTDDLLSVLIGALVIDTVIIAMNYGRFIFVSDQLTRWYTTCRVSAMTMDTLIIVLYATRLLCVSHVVATDHPYVTIWHASWAYRSWATRGRSDLYAHTSAALPEATLFSTYSRITRQRSGRMRCGLMLS